MDIDFAHHIVLVAVGLPAVAAALLVTISLVLGVIGLPALPEWLWRGIGIAASAATLGVLCFGVLPGFDPERIGLQQVASYAWSASFGARLQLGVDGIGLCFLLSTAGLVPLAMLAGGREKREFLRAWVLVCLLLESSLLGALAATNLLAFIFFWAAGLIPILVWMGYWGGLGRARAASRIWTVEALALVALLFVAFVLQQTTLEQFGAPILDLVSSSTSGVLPDALLDGPSDATSTTTEANALDAPNLLDVKLDGSEQWILFLAMVSALAVRLPVVPLHFWLPAAHASAPTGLSVLLATGFVQTAAIGLLRFALPLFPDAAMAAGPTLSLLGIFALVYASLIALVQKELKRLVAYASVGYAGFALFGISTLNAQGLTGAVLQLLTHGLAAAGLFTLTGFLARRRNTTEVAAFGGLASPMPVCAFFFGVMVLSLMGLPLLGGFVGDLFVLLGSLETRRELSVVALVAMVVAASYLLWVQRRIFLGPVEEAANRGLIDLDRIERGVLLAMTIPIIAIGVYPNPVLRRVEPAVLDILYQMQRRATPVPVEEGEGVAEEELARVQRAPAAALPAGKVAR